MEPWLDIRATAAHFSCSLRVLEKRMVDGMPHAIIFGKAKFRISEVTPWLEGSGDLEWRGDRLPVPEQEVAA